MIAVQTIAYCDPLQGRTTNSNSNIWWWRRMPDSTLQRIARGDETAVNDCIDRYGDLLWSLARRFIPEHSEAEDAVQEIFIDIWINAGRFDPAIASEVTFVSTIARRRLIDRARKLIRRPQTETLEEDLIPADENLANSLETHKDIVTVTKLLAELNTEQQRALELSMYYGYSHAEIARQMMIPVGTVKTHLRRGLLRIRQQLLSPPTLSQGEFRS